MAAYADALPTPDFAEIIRTATPLSEPATMRFPASIRRRYENLSELPEGFLVVADALCAFNPVYGQGMTVAALEAQALLRLLREGREDITRRFFRAAAEIVDSPWNIMLGNDLRFPHAEGPLTPQIGQSAQYMDAFRAAAADDAVLATALLRVLHLMDPPARLQDPALRERVARATKAAA
jgi:2-polyprenyl-6-methoxyphenol hydroxylase-like FAD-dependent oxidoreductase